MTVTIDIEAIEIQALEGEYKKRGLGSPTSGYVSTPLDSLHTKLAEAVRALEPEKRDPHVRRFGTQA